MHNSYPFLFRYFAPLLQALISQRYKTKPLICCSLRKPSMTILACERILGIKLKKKLNIAYLFIQSVFSEGSWTARISPLTLALAVCKQHLKSVNWGKQSKAVPPSRVVYRIEMDAVQNSRPPPLQWFVNQLWDKDHQCAPVLAKLCLQNILMHKKIPIFWPRNLIPYFKSKSLKDMGKRKVKQRFEIICLLTHLSALHFSWRKSSCSLGLRRNQ